MDINSKVECVVELYRDGVGLHEAIEMVKEEEEKSCRGCAFESCHKCIHYKHSRCRLGGCLCEECRDNNEYRVRRDEED